MQQVYHMVCILGNGDCTLWFTYVMLSLNLISLYSGDGTPTESTGMKHKDKGGVYGFYV